jgi:rubrerythrin
MDLEKALKTAIDYENKVRETYQEARDKATSDTGRRVFNVLCNEEQGHIDYLNSRLDQWQEMGKITVEKLGTAIPPRAKIDQAVAKLKDKVAGKASGKHDVELEMLKRALDVEIETSNFYKEMVRTLDAEGKELFERFVTIEQGHQAIVQAEIDLLIGAGFWFDIQEFSTEM